jgi:hypothetical protein
VNSYVSCARLRVSAFHFPVPPHMSHATTPLPPHSKHEVSSRARAEPAKVIVADARDMRPAARRVTRGDPVALSSSSSADFETTPSPRAEDAETTTRAGRDVAFAARARFGAFEDALETTPEPAQHAQTRVGSEAIARSSE